VFHPFCVGGDKRFREEDLYDSGKAAAVNTADAPTITFADKDFRECEADGDRLFCMIGGYVGILEETPGGAARFGDE
jgi:hypothetical protein